MEYILAALISIPNIFGYEYVGYHECKQVGYIEVFNDESCTRL